MQKYQAILMAAGVGSRISAHTNKPKSTLSISENKSNKTDTIIGHTLDMLDRYDFKINLIVGYRKEIVKDQLSDFKVNYFENPYYRITNSIASLWFAKEALLEARDNNQPVILGNADVFWGEEILDEILADKSNAVMLADRTRVEVGDYFFNVSDEGILLDNGKQLKVEDRNCEYVGIAKIEPEFIDTFIAHLDELIWNEDYNMWWEDVLYSYKESTPVKVLDVNGLFWGEVDTLEDYQRIIDHLSGRCEKSAQ